MARTIDLTFPIEEDMTTFPVHWHPTIEIKVLGRLDVEARETRKLVLGTHTGTHLDAPRHFIAGGTTIDQIDVDILVGPAKVLDLTWAERFSMLGPDIFENLLGDKIHPRLILRFDWSDNWKTEHYYSDHPFLSVEAAQWLVDHGIKLLAMDTPMPDNPKDGYGCDIDSPIHKILLGNGCVLVEYLCNLREIRKTEVELIALPLKIRDGDGAPARCVAIEY